jgi:hypothetical protein
LGLVRLRERQDASIYKLVDTYIDLSRSFKHEARSDEELGFAGKLSHRIYSQINLLKKGRGCLNSRLLHIILTRTHSLGMLPILIQVSFTPIRTHKLAEPRILFAFLSGAI